MLSANHHPADKHASEVMESDSSTLAHTHWSRFTILNTTVDFSRETDVSEIKQSPSSRTDGPYSTSL